MENLLNINDIKTENKMSDEVFHEEIYRKLQIILIREFPDEPEKQIIKRLSDGLEFACPFCGDSTKNSAKKRGNFIYKEGPFLNMYKCFNCGIYMSISKFFNNFKYELTFDEQEYLMLHKPTAEDQNSDNNMSKAIFNVADMLKYTIPKKVLIEKYGLREINRQHTNRGYYYMVRRNQFNFKYFLYDIKSDSIIILNLVNGDNVASFQIRKIKYVPGYPKYITVSLSNMHKKLLNDNIEIPKELESLSMIFNIYNVDFRKTVMVTEGPLDALLLPNCIATLGASKKIPINYPFYYVYDSDQTGCRHALKHLENKEHVFTWSKLKEDLKLPSRTKWDINDVVNYCIENHLGQIDWFKYFTNDPMDGLDL